MKEMTEIQNHIEDMLNLQQKLNDHTNGIGWEKGINKYNNKIKAGMASVW